MYEISTGGSVERCDGKLSQSSQTRPQNPQLVMLGRSGGLAGRLAGLLARWLSERWAEKALCPGARNQTRMTSMALQSLSCEKKTRTRRMSHKP